MLQFYGQSPQSNRQYDDDVIDFTALFPPPHSLGVAATRR